MSKRDSAAGACRQPAAAAEGLMRHFARQALKRRCDRALGDKRRISRSGSAS